MSTPFIPLIPNLPTSSPIDKNGNLEAMWQGTLTQLFNTLKTHLSNEGLKVPQQPTTTINKITNPEQTTGNFLYDSTTGQLKFNVNGTWKIVTLT